MKIERVATLVISEWEHSGEYTCHGDGAYGLIGEQGQNLTSLLHLYVHNGGHLKKDISWYAPELIKRAKNKTRATRIIKELDTVAADPLMQKCQNAAAETYMQSAIQHQLEFYPFKTALAQLILCDMGVNNGIWNKYVKDALQSAPRQSERQLILSAMGIRIKAMKDHGIWDRYEGIRRRYGWYMGLWKKDKNMTLAPFQPRIEVNGRKVNIGKDPITVIEAV